ncbi:MAG: hypothetical protein WKF84_06825 [Pyrinomonadaceae bacterium]
MRTYAQMKVLLAMSASLDPKLRTVRLVGGWKRLLLTRCKTIPQLEQKLALAQYQALLNHARRPDGLPAQIVRDRRAEMTAFVHSEP